jgi:hypothetical protein
MRGLGAAIRSLTATLADHNLIETEVVAQNERLIEQGARIIAQNDDEPTVTEMKIPSPQGDTEVLARQARSYLKLAGRGQELADALASFDEPRIYDRTMGDMPVGTYIADTTRPTCVHYRGNGGWFELNNTPKEWALFQTPHMVPARKVPIEEYGHILAGGRILLVGATPTPSTTDTEETPK